MTRRLYLVALASALSTPALAEEPVLSPFGLLQVWGTVWDQDEDPQADSAGYGDPEADPGVSIRRARLGLGGRFRAVDYRLTVGTAAPPDVWFEDLPLIGVIDAYGGVTVGAGAGTVRFSAGQQKVPTSREVLISSRDLLFQERAVVSNHLSPNRQAGLLVEYKADMGFGASAGVYNGNENLFGDDNWGVLAAGRIEYGHGDAYTTYSATRSPAWGVGISGLYNDDVATGTLRVGADALVRMGPIAVLADGAWAQIKPTDTTVADPDVADATNQWGALLQLSGTVPVFSGGIEIGARAEIFDDSVKLRDNGDVLLVFGGASWRDPIPGVDFGLGYIHRTELAGRTIPNDTVRLWAQVRYPLWREGTKRDDVWTDDFVGTWVAGEPVEGVRLTLWETPDGVEGTAYVPGDVADQGQELELPVQEWFYDPSMDVLSVLVDSPTRGALWVELQPQRGGDLCGWGFEDGRRDEAIRTGEGGAWVCWTR